VALYRPTRRECRSRDRRAARRGFVIEAVGLALSISGPRELFERECGVVLTQVESRLEGERADSFLGKARGQ